MKYSIITDSEEVLFCGMAAVQITDPNPKPKNRRRKG